MGTNKQEFYLPLLLYLEDCHSAEQRNAGGTHQKIVRIKKSTDLELQSKDRNTHAFRSLRSDHGEPMNYVSYRSNSCTVSWFSHADATCDFRTTATGLLQGYRRRHAPSSNTVFCQCPPLFDAQCSRVSPYYGVFM